MRENDNNLKYIISLMAISIVFFENDILVLQEKNNLLP